MTILIILAVIVAIGLTIIFESQLGRTARNRVSDVGDILQHAIADPVKDGEADIKAAQKEVDHLNSTIAELITSTKQLEHKVENAKADAEKFEHIAVAAGQAGNKDDVITAITKKKAVEAEATTLQKEIDKNHALEAQLKDQVRGITQKISDAENGKVRLSAILASSALRESVAKAAAGATNNAGLAGLDNLAKAADEAEAKAAAWEDIANTSTAGTAASLEKKYAGAAVSDDELSKYIKA